MNRLNLTEQTRAYGCPELVDLAGVPTASHIEYLDLLPGRSTAALLPEAVAELQGRPVMYLVADEVAQDARRRDADAVRKLQQLLANRSEEACLGIVRPGQLDVYPINLDRKQLAKVPPRVIRQSVFRRSDLFSEFGRGRRSAGGATQGSGLCFSRNS